MELRLEPLECHFWRGVTGFECASGGEAALESGQPLSNRGARLLFEAFWSTKGQRGTGLGLAVTRKIVQEHGGEVTLESTEGEGAAFVITLPSDSALLRSADTELPRPRPAAELDEF